MRTKQMPRGMKPKLPAPKKRKNKLAAIEKRERRSRRGVLSGFNNTGLVAVHVVEALVNDEQRFIVVRNTNGNDASARKAAVEYVIGHVESVIGHEDLPVESVIVTPRAVLYLASGIESGQREEATQFFVRACQKRLEEERERERVDLTLAKELGVAEVAMGGEGDEPGTAESGD